MLLLPNETLERHPQKETPLLTSLWDSVMRPASRTAVKRVLGVFFAKAHWMSQLYLHHFSPRGLFC